MEVLVLKLSRNVEGIDPLSIGGLWVVGCC